MQSKSQNEIKIEKLVKGMNSLNLINYGSADIGRFESCVNPDPRRKAWALETAKTNLKKAGTTTMGLMGTGVKSTRGMAVTADKVRERKIGVCHELAQLGADHLLKQMDAGVIPRSSLKIVSHKAGFGGTHTFLLLDHSGDLSDLSKCVIVDPWAVTMGFVDKQGVYTSSNYPYKGMTKNLKLVFEVDIQGNEIAHTAEKAAVNVVPPEERGDREKVKVSQEPVDLQSVLRKTGNKDALLKENKTNPKPEKSVSTPAEANQFQGVLRRTPRREALLGDVKPVKPALPDEKPVLSEKPVAAGNNVSQGRQLPTTPRIPPAHVASITATETQRHSSLFHNSNPVKPSVSAEEVRLLMGDFYKKIEDRDTASNKANILRKLAFSVKKGEMSPESGVLSAVDLMLSEDKHVSETSWKRRGEPTVSTLREVFGVLNKFDESRAISNLLRKYSGQEESPEEMRNKSELIQVSDKILNDSEVVRDISPQNSTGLRV